MSVVIKEVAYGLYYVPDFVRYGSKPSRDIEDDPNRIKEIYDHLRSYEECVAYPPHQVFIGNLHPDDLNKVAKPYYENQPASAERQGPFGEIMPEDEFYAWMKVADDFDLLWLEPDCNPSP